MKRSCLIVVIIVPLLLLLLVSFVSVSNAHKSCGTEDPTELHRHQAHDAERHLFGKTVE